MAKVQVLRLSEKHQQIIHWMIANPTEQLGDVAARFNVSQSWLSVLIHSDTFQESLRKKSDETFHPAQLSLQEKLTGLAHLALDKLGESIDNGQVSPGLLLETSSGALDRLGYGTKPNAGPLGPTQNNFFLGSVPSSVLQDARETFGRKDVIPAIQPTQEERAELAVCRDAAKSPTDLTDLIFEEVPDEESYSSIPPQFSPSRDSSAG
jgi:hypothetical protein